MLQEDIPNYTIGNVVVFVSKHVADPHHLLPWDLRAGLAQFFRNAPARLGNDLDPTLRSMP